MAPFLFLLLLPFLVCSTGSAQGGNASSLTTADPLSGMNQTSVTQRTTQKRHSTEDEIEYIFRGADEEYNYDYDEETSTVTHTSPVAKDSCQYDRCEHLAPTCEEVQWRAGGKCLCPGTDGPNVTPDFPHIKEVLLGETQMTVTWCSPSSTIRGYKVLYGEPGGSMEEGPDLDSSFRSYTIDKLQSGFRYTVCVVAFNEAGKSQVAEVENTPGGSMPGPCRIVQTTMQSLYIGVGIGLTAVVGLLFILGYFLCIRQRNKTKREAKMDNKGISNYTYKAGSIDHL